MTTPDESDIFLAKWLYESWSMLALQPLGPGYRLPQFAERIADVLQPALDRVIGQCNQVDERTWDVPSPWHAALNLGSMQHHLSLKGGRMLLRGQSNAAWAMKPSIARATDPANERERATRFCEMLSSLSFNTMRILGPLNAMLRFSPHSYLASAQHYGIRTDLIDFTTDAAIAVFFACSDALTATHDQMASVGVLPLDVAFENGCEVILPPPFVRRLYTQRGVFVRAAAAIDPAKLSTMEIRFPADHSFKPFRVVRSNVGVVDVLADSTPLSAALAAVDAELKASASAELRPQSLDLDGLKEAFSFVYRDPIGIWSEYVDAFEDQLYWLAYTVDDAAERLNINYLWRIARMNRELAIGVAQLYRWFASEQFKNSGWSQEKREHFKTMARLLESAAANGADS